MFRLMKKNIYYARIFLLYICKKHNMKPSALEIANKIILNTDIEKGDVMTNLKLQKLLRSEGLNSSHVALSRMPSSA